MVWQSSNKDPLIENYGRMTKLSDNEEIQAYIDSSKTESGAGIFTKELQIRKSYKDTKTSYKDQRDGPAI